MNRVLSILTILLVSVAISGFAQKPTQKTGTKTKPAAAKTTFNLSVKNRKIAQTAVNTIGEIDSVVSVGANYTEFSRVVQSAKIRFDSIMRDFEAKTLGDRLLLIRFSNIWKCYTDAKEAWGVFVNHGDKYGDLDNWHNDPIGKLAETYGFKGEIKDRLTDASPYTEKAFVFSRDTVVGAILNAGSVRLDLLRKDIKRGSL